MRLTVSLPRLQIADILPRVILFGRYLIEPNICQRDTHTEWGCHWLKKKLMSLNQLFSDGPLHPLARHHWSQTFLKIDPPPSRTFRVNPLTEDNKAQPFWVDVWQQRLGGVPKWDTPLLCRRTELAAITRNTNISANQSTPVDKHTLAHGDSIMTWTFVFVPKFGILATQCAIFSEELYQGSEAWRINPN